MERERPRVFRIADRLRTVCNITWIQNEWRKPENRVKDKGISESTNCKNKSAHTDASSNQIGACVSEATIA